MNPNNVVVNILVTANPQGAQGFNNMMVVIQQQAHRTAQNSANSFSTIFGANFFAGLAERMAMSMTSGFSRIITGAIDASKQAESAFKGLESLGRNVGLGEGVAQSAVKNLDLVKSGLLDISDAATATKNLLASGFNLDQSLELIRRFGDTAAFGRQAALSFGYAIASATEGIKNSNSILVDNAGVTKNLSVIMKDMGKSEKDLMNIRTDASARMALYTGLINETNLQHGDSIKLLDTMAGKTVMIESAWLRFLRALGDTITQNELVKSSLSGIVTMIDFMGKHVGSVIALTAAIGLMTVAVALSTTSFSTLTVAQIANATAGSGLAKILSAIPLLLADIRLAAALTAGEMAILSGGILAIVIALGVVVTAIYQYATASKEITRLSNEELDVHIRRRSVLNEEITFLNSLTPTINQVGTETLRLKSIYDSLDPTTAARIGMIKDETQKTEELIKAKKDLAAASLFGIESEGAGRVEDLAKSIIEQNRLTQQSTEIQQEFNEELNRTKQIGFGDQDIIESIIRLFNNTSSLTDAQRENTAEQTKNNEVMDKAARSVMAYAEQFGVTIPQAIEAASKVKDLGVSHDALQAAIAGVINKQKEQTQSTSTATNAIQAQIAAIYQLDAAMRQSARQKFISGQIAEIAELSGGDVNKAREMLKERSGEKVITGYRAWGGSPIESSLGDLIDETRKVENVSKKLTDDIFPKQASAAKKTKSEYENLSGSLRKLRGEIESYTNLSARSFQLRFQKEELERVKRDFETIISLRRELEMPLATALPMNQAGAKDEIERLERIKSIRDEIVQIAKEGIEAQDQLLIAQTAATMAVVSAQVLADTTYFQNIRKRAESEQQLTADIITEIRRRTTAEIDAKRTIGSIQAEAYKNFLQEQNDADENRMKNRARLELLAGGSFTGNPLINASGTASTPSTTSPVLQRMDTTNVLLKSINKAVGGESGSAGSSSGSYIQKTGSSSAIMGRNDKGSAIIMAAKILGIDPIELGAIISYESVGTFSPTVKGGKGGRYTGLIQFGPEEYKKYKVGQNKTFEDQLFNSVIPFLQDRTRKFGGTAGMDMLGLYKTINGGNPGVSSNASDGIDPRTGKRQTIRDHVIRIRAEHVPAVMNKIFKAAGANDATMAGSESVMNLPNGIPAPEPDFEKLQRLNRELNKITLTYFHMFESDKRLSAESEAAIGTYLESQKRLREEGVKGLRLNAIGQDQMNQEVRVTVTQIGEMAVAEDRLARLRSRNARDVKEVLNDEKTRRDQELASMERQIILNEQLLRQGGRDIEKESSDLTLTRQNILLDTGRSLAELDKTRNLNLDQEVQLSRQATAVISERTDMEVQLVNIQNERVTGPYNQALREEVAIQRELLNIQNADLEAKTQIAVIGVQMADKTVYHQDQANAKVLEHINQVKGLTDIYADAKIGIVDGLFGGIDNIFTKLTGKIPIVSRLLADMLSSLMKLFLSPILSRMLGGGGGQQGGGLLGGGGGQGGGGGFNIGSILGGLFNRPGANSTGPGGTPNFNPTSGGGGFNFSSSGSPFGNIGYTPTSGNIPFFSAQNGFFGNLPGSGGSSQQTSTQLLTQLTNQENLQSIIDSSSGGSGMMGGASNAAKAGVGAATSGAGLSALGSFGLTLPFLGMGIGSSLFPDSKAASFLGGAGGLLAGVGALGLAAPGLLAGGIGAATGASIGTSMAIAASLAWVGAFAGPALLVGAYFLNRNKLRRKEETQRSAILVDSKAQMQSIIEALRSGQMDSSSALAQANQIRASYLQQVSQLKDKKTRRIATETVRELDAMIMTIKSEGRRADYAKAQDDAIVPTFAAGGYASGGSMGDSQFTGFGSSNDNIPAILHRREVILNDQNIQALGGYNAMRRAGVRGINMFPSRSHDTHSFTSSGSGSSSNVPAIYNIMVADEKAANALYNKVKNKGVARKMRLAVFSGDDDGFSTTIERKLAGDF